MDPDKYEKMKEGKKEEEDNDNDSAEMDKSEEDNETGQEDSDVPIHRCCYSGLFQQASVVEALK